ncbi:MAG TPA: hypothetical protein VJX91_05945 [Candidatus Eisenbacteria bacterium]|nr:hypothetical protein [Candidatus Eisenbacteria bacterium]
MKTPTGMTLLLWVMVGTLAGAVAWGPAPARAGGAASSASQPYIAPIDPAFDKSQHEGRIGVGEQVRDQGSSLRKDLIRKRTIGDIVDRSKRGDGTGGGGTGGGDPGTPTETINAPLDTQPISLSYRPVSDPPNAPEPSGFALAGIGVASLILYRRRGKR